MLLLFLGSGCAALIYEIVWFQVLQLVIGSSAVSLGVLLATFMGGMCLGSLLLPKYVSSAQHPLKVYAKLEIGIAICGILIVFGVPVINGIYAAIGGGGVVGITIRALFCILCLLPPTLMMGATLPAIARYVETSKQGISWLGFFYGGNIVGAVFGCLLAGFYLLRYYDMPTATFVAAALNLLVAFIAFQIASKTKYEPADNSAAASLVAVPGASAIYLCIAISGLTALACEVIWTRIISLIFGGTVYTFSIILAMFLVGLGIGSSVGAGLAGRVRSPRLFLGIFQMLLAGGMAWTALISTQSLPYWPIDLTIARDAWMIFQVDLMRTVWAVLPPAFLWGASFPLALASIAQRGQDAGRLVGGVYAANTVGAILGAAGASLLLIPTIGTQHAQQALIILAAVSGILAIMPLLSKSSDEGGGPLATAALFAGCALAGFCAYTLPAVPPQLIAYGRDLPARYKDSDVIYSGEGMNASIAISRIQNEIQFHVSGKVEASTLPQDMRLQRMLAHIPAMIHPNPQSVLIVGFGAGVTSGTFVVHPSVKRIVIVEIEPLIPKITGKYFAKENYNVLTDPRTQLIIDDARHYILTSKEKFDIITSDPIHPWVKGNATLYSKEYFELCRKHLNPGGVVTQWVPLYESDMETVKSEVSTFFSIFPNGTFWGNQEGGSGYDSILLGQENKFSLDLDALYNRATAPDHAKVMESMAQGGFPSVNDLLSTYAGKADDLRPWMADAQINTDRNLRLQYLAGFSNFFQQAGYIYSDMLRFRKPPNDIFKGNSPSRDALLSRLQTAH
jgi:spermidine synthase